MNRLILYILLFFYNNICLGQINLVPNWSFENKTGCPSSVSQFFLTNNWSSPTNGTPDLFDSCTVNWAVEYMNNFRGSQLPKTGSSYCGILLGGPQNPLNPVNRNKREYIQNQLTDTLIQGHIYYVSFYVSLSDLSSTGSNRIGLCFTSLSINASHDTTINITPHIMHDTNTCIIDKVNWVKIEGSYIANGGEKYIIIGNFYTDNKTDTIPAGIGSLGTINYYYIDDVSVIDSTTIGLNEKENMDKAVVIYPNPAVSELTILLNNFVQGDEVEIELYNALGKRVYATKYFNQSAFSISVSQLNNGIYNCVVSVNGIVSLKEKIIVVK